MARKSVSDRSVKAFRRFLQLLPHGKDVDLVILKAHLLIEEQLRHIIDERVRNRDALDDARLGFHQCACLVEAFFPPDFEPSLWQAVKKLNKIRNKIAHEIEPTALQNTLDDLVNSFPSGFGKIKGNIERLELTLWSLFVAVSDLIQYPSAMVLELAPRAEK